MFALSSAAGGFARPLLPCPPLSLLPPPLDRTRGFRLVQPLYFPVGECTSNQQPWSRFPTQLIIVI